MITKERNKELRDLAARRLAASEPDPEAHALAVKKNAGKATPSERKRLAELLEKPGISGRGIPAFLNSDVEAERVRAHTFAICNERLAGVVEGQTRKLSEAQRERHEAETRAANIRRDNLVVTPGAMPDGDVGDEFRALAPDVRQIVNLRLSANIKGHGLTWREVADQFQRTGKPGRKYTRQRCCQLFKEAMKENRYLAWYCDQLAEKARVDLTRGKPLSDSEYIESLTTETQIDKDQIFDKKDGPKRAFRITRKPNQNIP